MTEEQILVRLTAIFRVVFADPDLALTQATTADMIPQWDSMSQITLAVEIEFRFGIKVKAAEMERMRSIRGLLTLIEARLPVDVH